ncbi:1,3--beta-D-glucan 3-glucanohydrolase, partial [Clostridium perfringens]
AKLSQCTDTGADNQLWKIEDMDGGVYKFVNKKSSKIIDVPGSSTSNSTILIQYSDNNTANQFWNIKRVE